MFRYSYKCAACLLGVKHSQIEHYAKIKDWSNRNPSSYDNEPILLLEQIERADREVASHSSRIIHLQKINDRGKIGKLKRDDKNRGLRLVERNKDQDQREV